MEDDTEIEQAINSEPDGMPPLNVGADEFEQGFGEPLSSTLNLETWQSGANLHQLYGQLESEIHEAVRQEDNIVSGIRTKVFPALRTRPGAPSCAGVYAATVPQIEKVHCGLLLNGQVEAVDGTSAVHDTLPLTIVQIGVALVGYQGDQGTWAHRLFRRDLRVGGKDVVEEALQILDRRRDRNPTDVESGRDTLASLGRRGIMAYAERSVLLNRAKAPWRMGHGSAAPYELLTGSGMRELLDSSLDLLQELLVGHRKFIFVPSAPPRWMLTIGNALRPLEYAVVDTVERTVRNIAEGHYRGEWKDLLPKVRGFAADVASKVVVGVYRASRLSPPQVFYAHQDFVHEAAMIVMADSTLHEHRGFPMLIDLADTVCSATFGNDSLVAPAQAAYAERGRGYQFATERQTRRG